MARKEYLSHGKLIEVKVLFPEVHQAALPNCWILEVALTNPPLLPWEQWEHCLALVDQERLFEVEDGYFTVPDRPGIGLAVNDEAVEGYRVG